MIKNKELSSEQEKYALYYKNLQIGDTQYLAFKNLPQYVSSYKLHNCKILDYGCGAGKSTRFLRQFSDSVTGVDINQSMVEAARKMDSLSKYIHITNAEIPSENNHYDFIFSSWVLVELSSKAEILKVLKEIYRVLKPGGIYISVVCNENTYSKQWRSLKGNFLENRDLHSGKKVKIYLPKIDLTIYDYYWSHQDYIESFALANFSLQKTDEVLAKIGENGLLWKDEAKYAPYTSYILKKPG